jgi:hypothetical protein
MLCTTMACMNGTCIPGLVPAGVQCDGNVCDGAGSCVDCVEDNDCPGENADCNDNRCISCSDGEQNGDETDIDCGGSDCAPCTGMPWAAAAECATNYCVDGVCCDAPCINACKACNLTDKVGTCSSLPAGQEDPGACDATMACGTFGSCKLKNGQMCQVDSECLSDNCSTINYICEP